MVAPVEEAGAPSAVTAVNRGSPLGARRSQRKESNAPLLLYCALITSTLLHLGARLSVLGAIHIDLLLAGAAVIAWWQSRSPQPRNALAARTVAPKSPEDRATRRLLNVLIYIVLTIPFVEWPGSVVKNGAQPFLTAVMFYFLTLGCVRTTRDLRIFLTVYVACQCFRVLEPLYLHWAYGYWGSATSMTDTEFMDRLSGAPLDIVNPNGLAFIIVSILPLLFFIQRRQRTFVRLLIWGLMGTMSYALILTGSRSGFLVFLLLVLAGIWNSRSRILTLSVLALATMFVVSGMNELQRDRYLSIFRSDVKGASTAQGRLDGVIADFKVALNRPVFGHGLGTSVEANAHYRGYGQISHNLYTEVAQELGFVGLGLFLAFVTAAVQAAWHAHKLVASAPTIDATFDVAARSILVLLIVDLVFSFASFGLSESYWYLIAGLAVVITRIVKQETAKPQGDQAKLPPTRGGPHARFGPVRSKPAGAPP